MSANCGKCGKEADACCCSEPAAEPEPAACPKCRDRDKVKLACAQLGEAIFASCQASTGCPAPAALCESAPLIKWISAWQARQCRGEAGIFLMAEIPAVPPVVSSEATTSLSPVGLVVVIDLHFSSARSAPLEPPPRCG
jgi:hypothetical protein